MYHPSVVVVVVVVGRRSGLEAIGSKGGLETPSVGFILRVTGEEKKERGGGGEGGGGGGGGGEGEEGGKAEQQLNK
jgi:hypothetical protein